jgi:hypothetical protein
MSSAGEILELKKGKKYARKGIGVFDAVFPVRIFFLPLYTPLIPFHSVYLLSTHALPFISF